MSSSIHIDNRRKDILFLGRAPTQGLESTLTAEKMYSINFTVTRKKFCLSLHYNRANSYLFVNGTEMYKFKAKDSAIIATLYRQIHLFIGDAFHALPCTHYQAILLYIIFFSSKHISFTYH